MIALTLDEQRCTTCKKLLFRGSFGFGFVEAKCSRCGNINVLNSFDTMLRATKDVYIIVYNNDSQIIASSSSTEDLLHYTGKQLADLTMCAIDKDFPTTSCKLANNIESLDDWETLHNKLPTRSIHLTSQGEKIPVIARYYPIGTLTGIYSIGVFKLRNI